MLSSHAGNIGTLVLHFGIMVLSSHAGNIGTLVLHFGIMVLSSFFIENFKIIIKILNTLINRK